MRSRLFAFAVAAAITFAAQPHTVVAQQARPAATPSIDDRVAGLRKIDGYFPLYWDDRAGTLLLEIPRFDSDFLFSTGLSAGLGSNDIGLDRGGGGQGRVVRFHRVGPKIMLVQPNQSFRSSAANPRERKSVEDSFAQVDSLGLHGRRGIERPRARRRDAVLSARHTRCGPGAASRRMACRSRRAVRSICRTRGISRRTPRST